jgi:hypothetical protein
MSMTDSNDTIGNRSRDLPVCSAVPQPLRHRVPQKVWVLFVMWPANIFGRFRKIAKSNCWLRHVRPPARLPAWNISAPNGQIFMKFDILAFFENLPRRSFIKI